MHVSNIFAAFVRLCCLCSFQTQDVRSSGPYVVAVVGERNGRNKFWETLLYNDASEDVKPISKLKAKQLVLKTKLKETEAALLWGQK